MCEKIHQSLGLRSKCFSRFKSKAAKKEASSTAPVGATPTPVTPNDASVDSPHPALVLALYRKEILEALKSNGFCLVKVADNPPPGMLQRLIELASDPKYPSTGIDNGENVGKTEDSPDFLADQDQKRRALPLEPHIPKVWDIFVYLNDILTALGTAILNEWRQLVGWHLLVSLPGLVQQIWHKDYDMVLESSSEDIYLTGRHFGKKRKRAEGRRDAAVPEPMMPISIIVSL